MFQRILIATDDSPVMESAARYAAGLFPKAEYHVLTVIDTKKSKLPSSQGIGETAKSLSRETLGHAERILTECCVQPRLSETHSGDPAKEILAYVDKHHIELLVMGEGSKFGVQRLQLGSTCVEVLEAIKCPVLLLGGPTVPKVPAKILNPTTGSKFGDNASELAITLASYFKADMTSVFVGKGEGKRVLDQIEAKAKGLGVEVKRLEDRDDPAKAIITCSKAHDIMVASRGRCGLQYRLRKFHREFALGHLEREILVETKIPLILVGD